MNTTISSINQSLCATCEESLKRNLVISNVNLLLNALSLASFAILMVYYFRVRILVHGNLLLLFANILLLSLINSICYFALYFRSLFLYLTYSNPCELLSSFWLAVLFLGPSYLYYFAYPAFHVCVMLERARATYLADKYEGCNHRLGWQMTIGIWIASIIYTTAIVYLAYIDTDLSAQPQAIVTLNSHNNSNIVLIVYIFFIPVMILTAFFDWQITRVNNRIRAMSKNFKDYSLSRNYQLNENTLAMRLILPLDVFYALLYTIFNVLAIIIRSYKPFIPMMDYIFYYYTANVLNYVYTLVTLIVYIRFVQFIASSHKNNVYAQPTSEHAKIYFKQLNAQWQ